MSIDMERLLDAMRMVESGGDPGAVSPKGARGPFQFMPATAKEFGLTNPHDEVAARNAARIKIGGLLKYYKGDVSKALVAWNWGEGNLDANGMDKMPAESRGFLTKVMNRYSGSYAPEPTPVKKTSIDSLFPGEGGQNRIAAGDESLRRSVLDPLPTDKASRIYRLQLRTGLPSSVIESNLDQIERQTKAADFDAAKFRAQSPLLADWLAKNTARASVAQGDYESLSALEKAWQTLQAGPAGIAQGIDQKRMMDLNYKAVTGAITPQENEERKRLQNSVRLQNEQFTEGFPSWVKSAAETVGIMIPQLAESTKQGAEIGLPLGAAGGAALGAIGGPAAPVSVPAGAVAGGIVGFKTAAGASFIEQTYRLSVGEAFDDLEGAKDAAGNRIDPTAARYAALLVGVPNALMEFASLRQAIKVVPGAEKVIGKLSTNAMKQVLTRPTVMAALKDFGKKYAVAVGTEGFTEGMQKLLTILSREIATGDMGKGFSQQDVQAIGAEAAAAAKGSAVLGLLPAGPKVIELHHDMRKAQQNAEFMRGLGEIVSESKTQAASPEAMKDFVSTLKKDGPVQNVFIPIDAWQSLFQSEAKQAAQEVFGNLNQYSEAVTTGGDLVVPIEVYASKLAATPFHEQLLQEIRLAPGDMNLREAAEAENFIPDIESQLDEQTTKLAEKEAPLSLVYQDVYQKLRNVGEGEVQARREALLTKERLRARAERLNVDPWELYQEMPLTIQRAMPGQIPPGLETYNQQLAEPAVPHSQRLQLKGGETRLPKATPQESRAAAEALSAASKSHADYGVFGATVHPDKGNMSGTPGVAVAGYPQRGVITEGAPTQKDIETFLRRNRDIFKADKNAALGLWVDNETGKGYIDITNVLPREQAIAQGEYLGELALWDLEHGEEIRLPTVKESGQGVLFQSVFHGSRAKFDKFMKEHIGTGEGAQAYGYGLYFASKRGIAEWYRERLTEQSAKETIRVNGQPVGAFFRDAAAKINAEKGENYIDGLTSVRAGMIFRPIFDLYEGHGETTSELVDIAKTDVDNVTRANDDNSTGIWWKNKGDRVKELLETLRDTDVTRVEPDKGQLYKVDIPETDYLDWDKSFGEQSPAVQQAMNAFGIAGAATTGAEFYHALSRELGSPKAASEWLNDHGVNGIQYLDATSRGTGETSHNYVVFDDNAVQILETYYQGERGASVPLKGLIALLQKADPSTFVHESGHIWLEELGRDAQRPNAPEQLKADWQTIKDWTGATDNEISREAHEKFARGIEAYIMEGKAPSFQLREAFAQFKAWFVRIYKSMVMLDVELTPEVVEVMDRLLATDEAIKQMRERNTYHIPLLDESMMTAEEYAAYRKLNEEAKLQAEESFRVKVMKELRRERLATWRQERDAMMKQVRADILETPIYRAAYWLWSGKLPDGSTVEGMTATKLDKQALIAMGVNPNTLPFRYQENGVHPDIVAELFGFPSGESMVKELVGLPSLKDAIDQETSERMRQEHGDLLLDGTFEEQAAMEVQNTQQVDVFNMEMRILKRMGAKREMAHPAIMKDLARQIIDRKTIRELDPAIFEAAALKAAKEADDALLGHEFRMGTGRNLEAAFDAKQRQMLNVLLYREAFERRQMVDKHIKKWNKFLFRSDERLAKNYNMDMINAARAIAAAHGIGNSPDNAASYMAALKLYDPQSFDDLNDIVELAGSDGRAIEDLTTADFGVVRDAIEGLWTMARRSRQIEIDGIRMDRNIVVGELGVPIIGMIDTTAKRAGYERAMTNWDKTKMAFLGAKASLRRVEHWVDAMDNGDPQGVFRRYLWNPISEAADRYRDARRITLEKYLALVKAMPKSVFQPGKIDAPEIGYEFANKTELLGALLHTGNESNLSKLLRGRNWGVFTPEGDLDTRNWDAFIDRLQRDGVLTKDDFDFVQSVWDLLDELKPGAQKAHKEMYGFYFDEVTARPFNTQFGAYKGGYFPAIVDPFMVEDASIRQEREAMESRPSSFMFPTTGRGFTRARVEAYARPLSLDLGLVPSHIEKVLRFTMLEPHIKDIGRVLIDKDFRATLARLDSEVGSVMLVPWLQRAALQMVEQPSGPRMRQFDKFFHAVRTRTGLQFMAANVSVALQQIAGLSLSATKVKPRYLAGALWRYMSSPRVHAAQIANASTFMRNRVSTQVMDVHQAIDKITLNPSAYQRAKDFANIHGYFMQTGMQNVVDIITWSGAYEQATAAGLGEKDAVRAADSAVRETQGTFAPEDISSFEAGTPFKRMFTMFYSYFNMAANLNATEMAKAFRETGFAAGGRAMYVYLFGFMIPAVLADAITQAMSGALFDDDDDDGYLDNILSVFLGGQFRAGTAMVPIVGQVAQMGINAFNDKWYDDRISTSPAVSALEASARVPYDLFKLATDEEARMKRPIQDTLTLIGMATGLPVAPLSRPIGYAVEMEQGNVEPANAADLARGLISGRSPQ